MIIDFNISESTNTFWWSLKIRASEEDKDRLILKAKVIRYNNILNYNGTHVILIYKLLYIILIITSDRWGINHLIIRRTAL